MQLGEIDEQALLMALRHVVRAVHEQEQGKAPQQGGTDVPGGHMANGSSQTQPGTAEARAAAIASVFNQQILKETISNEFATLSLQQITTPENPQATPTTLKAAIEPVSTISLPRHPAARTLPAAAAFFAAASPVSAGVNTSPTSGISIQPAVQVLNDEEHLQALADGHAVHGFVCTFCDHYNMVRE